MSAPRHILRMPAKLYRVLWAHLLPRGNRREQAAFLFCSMRADGDQTVYDVREARFLKEGDFAVQAGDYLELTDETRIAIIKRAHALGACVAEFHSHPGPFPAAFSLSDRHGLSETVPHMRWRLGQRPYLAVVVAPKNFDALVFADDAGIPAPLAGIVIADPLQTPTNASLEGWNDPNRLAI